MSNELKELELEFKSVPLEFIQRRLTEIKDRIKNDDTLPQSDIPILQKRADLYKKYIDKRRKEKQNEFKKSDKVTVKKPLD